MSAHVDFANFSKVFSSTFDKHLPLAPPSKKVIVVTCMDARVDPYKQLGIEIGEAHVIRNAGGLAKDSIRSIVISQRLLGTREIAIFHHTDCGMLTFTNEKLRDIVKAEAPGSNAVANAVDSMDFLPFPHVEQSLKDDVEFVRSNPLVLPETTVTGWVYDVKTGSIHQIV